MPDLTGRIEGEKMGLFGKKKVDFVSPAGGRLMNITEVADPAFSSKMLGDGFAVDLTDGEIGAPFDGEVTAAFPTGLPVGAAGCGRPLLPLLRRDLRPGAAARQCAEP